MLKCKLSADKLKSIVGGDADVNVVPLDRENGTVFVVWTDGQHHHHTMSLKYNNETRYLMSLNIAKSIAHYINNDWDTTYLISVLLRLANSQGIIVGK